MQTVDENPDVLSEKPETIHLYVVREEAPKPSLFPICLSALALFLLFLLCVFTSYQQPYIQKTIRVPAVFLPVQSFATTAVMIPTGIKTYPATTAQGILTITNGSVIASTLPKGLIFVSSNGTEIRIDASTFVPAGNAAGYGYATVSAHALLSGKNGNIPANAINQVEGTSMYIRNLHPFTGGIDTYSVNIITSNDRNVALLKARTLLSSKIAGELLVLPCKEVSQASILSIIVNWTCQPITYSLPTYMQVTRVRGEGRNLLIDVKYQPLYRREGQK